MRQVYRKKDVERSIGKGVREAEAMFLTVDIATPCGEMNFSCPVQAEVCCQKKSV